MARELVKKQVDEHEYSFQQFGTKQSLKYLFRLSKIIGKPIALAMASGFVGPAKESVLDNPVKPELLAEAVEALVSQCDENETLDLIESFCGKDSCLCDDKPINFNLHYEGRLDHLFRVLAAALEVQYGNFFGAISGAQSKLHPKNSTLVNRT